MLRSIDGWDSEHFAFGGAEAPPAAAISAVAIDNGPDGPTATIPDAHLLFTAQFSRAGADLVLQGEDGKTFAVHDYFAADARARLLSPEGASLSPDVVAALAGPLAPGQFAQAGAPQTNAQAVGRVVQAEGGATIVRNGVAMQANTGDAILKGDVLQTAAGSLGVTFNDGSTLNITANSRLVVNEFVYDPRGSANSQLLDLVQGSLTFISGEVAHNGDMRIGTPVATMGIRGTVGGVTTASDGTVNFYVSQSATGAVIIDRSGTIIANVVQDGPLIVVRPVGPLQVLAEEVQKSPAQLATELAALQQIVSIQSVGQQIIQQFFQPNPNNPNPQSTDQPHTQIPNIQIELKINTPTDNGNDEGTPPNTAIVTVLPTPPTPSTPLQPDRDPIIVAIPVNLPPINFGPPSAAIDEDQTLTFAGQTAISVFDVGAGILTVTLSATHGILTLSSVAGLTFGVGHSNGAAAMTFSGPQAAINAALHGMSFTPDADYNGYAEVTIVTSDGNSTTAPQVIEIAVNAVNDAPVLSLTGYVEDRFNSQAYNLNTGSANWATDWIENENGDDYANSPTTGEIQITGDPTVSGGNFRLFLSDDDDEAGSADTVQRTANLSGASAATLTFDYRRDVPNGNSGDVVYVWISADGTNFTQVDQIDASGNGSVDSEYQHVSLDISNYISASTTIRFSADDGVDNGDLFYIDNVKIAYSGSATFVEGGSGVPVASAGATIKDTDSTYMQLATITLTNRQAADLLNVNGALPCGIVASSYNALTGVLMLTGAATLADYALALHQVEFSNTGDNPGSADRIITITVFDGTDNSNAVTTTIHVVPVNDAPMLSNDTIVTNFESGPFEIPDWILLQNDKDAESPLAITGVDDGGQQAPQFIVSHAEETETTAFTPSGSGPWAFDYTVTDSENSADASVAVTRQSGDLIGANGACDEILIANTNGSVINGGGGKDILVGNVGNETMTGGADADTFAFKPGNGVDVVSDFSGHACSGQGDVIALDGFSFASFADLQDSGAIHDVILEGGGHNTLIDLGDDNTITLEHVNPSDLVAADFAFHHVLIC